MFRLPKIVLTFIKVSIFSIFNISKTKIQIQIILSTGNQAEELTDLYNDEQEARMSCMCLLLLSIILIVIKIFFQIFFELHK